MNNCDKIFERAASLEDVANKLLFTVGNEGISSVHSFIKGAEYMKNRMYSEEEVLDLIALYARKEPFQLESWFNYHKK